MTAGLKRYYLEGSLHFITFSCYRRLPHLATPRRDLLLRVLEQARRRYRFALLGYVIMPEHVHLLMTMPAVGDPSVVMKVVKERFSRLLRKREALSDRVWQKRFYLNGEKGLVDVDPCPWRFQHRESHSIQTMD